MERYNPEESNSPDKNINEVIQLSSLETFQIQIGSSLKT